MRLWTLHPKYLDARGLVALWREALLAQAVLRGETKGYRHHPQLDRFKACDSPAGELADYLREVHSESVTRGYLFAGQKISRARGAGAIPAPRAQIEYEWEHLRKKLAVRDPAWLARLANVKRPAPNPVFRIVPGVIEPWEKAI